MAAASEVIDRSPTLWALTRDLLVLWRSTGVDAPHDAAIETRYHAWADAVEAVEERFGGGRSPDELSASDRAALRRLLTGFGNVADGVHAVAWGLSLACTATFAPAWRDELGSEPRVLEAGEPYPVADPPWRCDDGAGLVPRPASMTAPRRELPTVRIHDGSFDVTVDTTFERALRELAPGLSLVAAAHPNAERSELIVPDGDLVFPVVPLDEGTQTRVIGELVAQARDRGAAMTVLPELCATAGIVEHVAAVVSADERPFLVVAGSEHVELDGQRRNVATGLVSGTSRRLVHAKNAPFTNELRLRRPSREGIPQRERPHIQVYPAGPLRFSIAICRDLLDEHARRAYDRMGVNVLAVPAFSERTLPFVDCVGARAAVVQALTLVANGPLTNSSGERIGPDIVLGTPVERHTAVAVAADGAPSVTVVQTHVRV